MFKKIVQIFSIYYISGVIAYEKLENIDFYGGDLYPIYSMNDSMNCMYLCERIRDCVAVTHCDDTCYIKNKKMDGVEKEGCVTYDMYPDSDIWQSDWGSGSGSIEEPKEKIVMPETTKPVIVDNETITNTPIADIITNAPITDIITIGTPTPTSSFNKLIPATTALTTAQLLFFL